MAGFSGAAVTTSDAEPLVGEILGLRTFRVDDSGLLLPLYSDECWYDGANTAVCAPPTGDWRRSDHQVPADQCECGFYAYGTSDAARHNRNVRYVQAVVACWGAVVAGTQGVRAQHARIDAIWLGAQAPRWLRSRVASRYPSARMYADADAMLAEYPLTPLSCYAPTTRARLAPRLLGGLAAAALCLLGVLPAAQLHGAQPLWLTWLAVTIGCAALAVWLCFGTDTIGHVSAAAVTCAVLAWLLAPMVGVFGWLLRLPVLNAALVVLSRYLIALLPRHFPIVPAPATRPYGGVRS